MVEAVRGPVSVETCPGESTVKNRSSSCDPRQVITQLSSSSLSVTQTGSATVVGRFVNDREEACEVTQEAFLRAWRGIGNFRGDAAFFRRRRFMRDHRWTRDHLSSYIDRDLDSAGRTRVHRHTELFPECRRALATLNRTVQALRRSCIGEGVMSPAESEGPVSRPGPLAESVIGYLRRSG